MASLNKATIIGRLGQDPDVRQTANGMSVANLSVATSEKYKDKSGQQQETTEWHRVTFWGKLADIAQQYLVKGSLVYIEGKLQTRKWEDKNGADRYTTEIVGREMVMLGGNQIENQAPKPSVNNNATNQEPDSDLPF